MYKVVRVAQRNIGSIFSKNFWLRFTWVFVCLNTYLLLPECVCVFVCVGVLLERAAQCGNANQDTSYKLIVAS